MIIMIRSRSLAMCAVAASAAQLMFAALAPSASAVAGTAATSSTAGSSTPAARAGFSSGRCGPAAVALGYSDALDKLVYNGVELGGLSDLAYDARSGSWVSSVDNHGTDPSRLWFYRDLADPTVTRDPLVLKKPDGTPYDGTTADNEGLAVLPDGDFMVSSETEPSVRIYGRDGVQKASLPIPARFAVTGTTPAGEATSNVTLEGLTVAPSGRQIIAAMEGPLSGDVSGTDTTAHRFLVYDLTRSGNWTLTRQIGYRTDAGMRVPEVQSYRNGALLVEEASFSAAVGNAVKLYAVTGTDSAYDVSSVPNLASAPAKDFVSQNKELIADLVTCPTLGAPSRQIQTNPLLDNYEGMAVTPIAGPISQVTLISDDNFGATQFTRVLRLGALLP